MSANEIIVGHVEASVTGRYLLRAATETAAAPLLVGFHGYGEDAESILQALMEIPGNRAWHVVSIQALNQFYNRRNGQVVACWMTKQDRQLAIEANLAYVDRTLSALAERLEISSPRVYAGFSQGTAMAYRAAAAAGSDCHGVIALAGDVPPELAAAPAWGRPAVLIGRGTEDDWYNEGKWQNDERLLESLGSTVETCLFEGGHEWTGDFQRRAGDFLARLLG
ncbi:MAG: phospholipase [Acidobacteria bacterium]|nr:phospholipase [Acidobacteriota bacterium]